MSNIFAPLVRPFGTLPIELGSGPPVELSRDYMHMRVDDQGSLFVSNNAIHHYGAAVPFDVDGRVVISAAPVVRWDQGIPFTASGAVAVKEDPSVAHWDQGLTFLDTGHIAAGDVAPPPEVPIWSEIPDTANYLYELPQDYDVYPYVSDAGDPITSYNLIGAPDFFTVDNAGVVTAGVGTADAAHLIEVEACNSIGCSSTTFTWDLSTGNVPTWETIPNQQHRQNELEPSGKTLDIKPYASSDSGPILSYSLVTPPPGITMASGIITVAAGTAVSSYVLTVRAVNGVGAGDTTFTWDILETLTGPQWSPIPNTSNVLGDLPSNPTHDVSPYVTSNAGALRNWLLITPPVGFTIDQAGVVTASVGAVIAVHTVVVQVENDVGSASSSFQWTISADLLPPQWDIVTPEPVTSEELLPAPFDVSTFVSSNSGPLTGWSLVTPPTGFSINGSGVITAAAGTAVAVHTLTVEVTNDTGTTASAPFDWEILLYYVVPQWQTIPAQSNGDDELPATLDLINPVPYVTTNSGPLTTWVLVTPPTGFTIDAAGVITVAVGTAETTHAITVRVSNDEGSADSAPFDWVITDVLLPPQWGPDIPDQSTSEQLLPDFLLATDYVTTNDGPLVSWTLVVSPAGFSIDTNGRIDVAAGTAPGAYTLQVQVTNNSGTTNSNIFDWQIVSFYLPPQWDTIPAQSTEEQLLPVPLDVEPYVNTNHGVFTDWSLVSPPGGWTIDQNGVITVAAGRPVASYSITARVSNDSGSSDSAAFAWDILEEPLPPQWDPIPTKQDRVNTLPQPYDISQWVTSNSGSLTGWALIAPPTGFTINTAGVITAAAGTTVAIHSLTVSVSNDEGAASSAPFTWEVQEELLPPQWQTVPDKSDRINLLPQPYDMSFYVSSNAGTLINWRLASSPSGFSINSTSGVITATAAAGVAAHSLRVGVTNSQGEELSNTFTWTILEELLPPQWQTIPDKTTAYEDLPDPYDVFSYVSSNSGPLDTWSLVSPPAGFSIDQSGVITAATNAVQAANSITVRVYNDTGLAEQTFTWTVDAPLEVSYFHEFNADLGGFVFYRNSDITIPEVDDPNSFITHGVDEPVYINCLWNGSAYTPTAGFDGLLMECASTNYLFKSQNINSSPWIDNGGNAVDSNTWTNTLTNGGIYQVVPNFGDGDVMLMSSYFREDPDGAIYWNWYNVNDSEITFPNFDGLSDWTYFAMSPTCDSDGTPRWTVGALDSGSGNSYGITHAQAEDDDTKVGATTTIICSSTTTLSSRAVAWAGATLPDIGLPTSGFFDDHAGQLKIHFYQLMKVGFYWQHFFAIASPDFADYIILGRGGEDNTFRFYIRDSSGEQSMTMVQTIVPGEQVDFRWKTEANNKLKVWVDGVLAGTLTGNLAPWNAEPDGVLLGALLPDPNSTASCAVHTVRLVEGPVSDAEILAWT